MIRKAKPYDIKKCVAIEHKAFGESRNVIRKELNKQIKNKDYLLFVAELKGKIIGFVTAKKHAWNNSVYLERLYVSESERSKGCGSQLIAKIVRVGESLKARKIFVDTGERNKKAIRFYLKNGFHKSGYIKDFYKNPKDRNGIILAYDL